MIQTLNKLDIFMPFRHRKVLTRDDRLRLRITLPVAIMFFAVGFMVSVVGINRVSSFSSHGVMQFLSGQKALFVDTAGLDNSHLPINQSSSTISEGIRQATIALKKPKKPSLHTVSLSSGDTIAQAIQDIGISGQDAYQAVKALSEYFDPRDVKVGQDFDVRLKNLSDGSAEFQQMVFEIDPVREVTISKEGDEFKAALEEKELVKKSYAKSVKIKTSLYGSAVQAGIPSSIIAELIRVYSWDVDFQRDIRSGDEIRILYDVEETEDGDFVNYGDVSYANLTIGGKEKPIFRYKMQDGRVDYFQKDGQSLKKTLMRTPINGARLSSGFGMRKHPILGYNKMHKGVDFAAPTGTPIYAAGDGVIEQAGNNGAYGKYIRIRHHGSLKTAYAHLSKFGSGMTSGKRVEQGDIIGYVGTTGRSTGPHLHYEVLIKGEQVNPNRVDLPVGDALAGSELKRFKAMQAAIEDEYADALKVKTKVAAVQPASGDLTKRSQ